MTAKEIIRQGLYNQAVELMDNEIREELAAAMAPCTEEEFLTAYMDEHERRFCEPFAI